MADPSIYTVTGRQYQFAPEDDFNFFYILEGELRGMQKSDKQQKDQEKGGEFSIKPLQEVFESKQTYLENNVGPVHLKAAFKDIATKAKSKQNNISRGIGKSRLTSPNLWFLCVFCVFSMVLHGCPMGSLVCLFSFAFLL